MTTEEAIERIIDMISSMPSAEKDNKEALRMALEALKELPKRRKEAKRWKTKALQQEPLNMLKQIPEACKNCSNHPSNGGSGICFCTLGSMIIT